MHRSCFCCICLVVMLVVANAGGRAATAPPEEKTAKPYLTPQLSECTLQWDSRILKPARTQKPWRAEYAAGDWSVVLEKDRVLAVQDGTQKWSTKSPDGRRLYWLTGDRNTAYLGGYEFDEKTKTEHLDNPPRVRRLDLKTRDWLPDLTIAAAAKAGAKENESILSVLADDKQVAVLSELSSTEEGGSRVVAYRLTCFPRDKTKPLWSKRFPSAGEPEKAGAVLLWAAQRPNSAVSDIQHLAWLGDYILVCAGEVQDLVCLDRSTGGKHWRFPRIWENERGFIGPSVWQHILGSADTEPEPAKTATKPRPRKDKDATANKGAIIGGPLVVTLPRQPGEQEDHRIFVAVAKMPGGSFGDYLANCVVYEMNPLGELLSMAHVPRLIRGNDFRIERDGVVWACQENAFVKVACSKYSSVGIGMGGGGPDLISRIAWYRQLDREAPDAWLAADKAGDPVAFSDGRAFRVTGGGYVLKQADRVYHFPITLVDLKTGLDRVLTLNVPFQGVVPVPYENYSKSNLPDGNSKWRVFGPHLLAITQLRIDNGRLRVTLGMKDWSGVVDFEVLKP